MDFLQKNNSSESNSSEYFFKEGAYGCVFRPGMNCLGEKEDSKHITKIQMYGETSLNEMIISKFMETVIKPEIPFYEDMFAPIITSCILDLGVVKNETIKKCEIVQKSKNDATKKFVSNKIRYVGKYTLEPFLKLEFSENKNMFNKLFFQSHLYLLNSLFVLSQYNIIHYDLKQNNISIDQEKRIPIIIDFGLSFRFDDLITDFDYEQYFYIYYDKYPPWCLEINIISFIVKEFKDLNDLQQTIKKNEKKGKKGKKGEKKGIWKTSIIDTRHLIDIVNHHFKNNYVVLNFNRSIIDNAEKKWIEYIIKEFQNKTGEFIVRELMKSWKSWDNYALCVIFFSLFRSFFQVNDKKYSSYLSLITDTILSVPLERDECINTATKINAFMNTL
jgi:hypothetical protein